MDYLVYVLIAIIAFNLGFVAGSWFKHRLISYAGTILVSKSEDKIVYSLELVGNPEELQFEDEVMFKVDVSK